RSSGDQCARTAGPPQLYVLISAALAGSDQPPLKLRRSAGASAKAEGPALQGRRSIDSPIDHRYRPEATPFTPGSRLRDAPKSLDRHDADDAIAAHRTSSRRSLSRARPTDRESRDPPAVSHAAPDWRGGVRTGVSRHSRRTLACRTGDGLP